MSKPGDEEGDRALVLALRSGDSEAFDVVYDRHRSQVFSFLARLSGDRIAAEDLLQETFLRLASKAGQLDPDTRLRPWLFTVARNLFIDQRRRARLDFDRLRELSLWPTRAQRVDDTPFDLAAATQAQRRLERALIGLPIKYREAVLLVCVGGFEPAEAASMLGTTGETLRQRLSRGRRMLREALEER